MPSKILKSRIALLLTIIFAAIVLLVAFTPRWTKASSTVGPGEFTRYGLNQNSNPVIHASSTFTTHWTFSSPMPLRMSSLAHGVVYTVGMGQNWQGTPQGMVYALGAVHGRVLWQHVLNNWSMTAPIVAHGMVFVGTGNPHFTPTNSRKNQTLSSRHIIRGTGPNSIYAFNAQTGHLVWQAPTRGEIMPTSVYRNGQLFVADGAGNITDFNATNGHVIWKSSIGSYVSMASPDLVGNQLLVSGAHPYDLYSLNVKTGKVMWKAPFPSAIAGADDCSIASTSHGIYILGTIGTWNHAQSRLYAYSLSGHLQWMLTRGAGPLPFRIEVGPPAIVGNTVYFSSPLSNKTYAVNATTGKEIWSTRLPSPVKTSVAVVGNEIIAPTAKNSIVTLNKTTGAIIHIDHLPGKFLSFPIVLGHTVYITSDLGKMFAIPLSQLS